MIEVLSVFWFELSRCATDNKFRDVAAMALVIMVFGVNRTMEEDHKLLSIATHSSFI